LNYAISRGWSIPSSSGQTVQNQLVADLKNNGIWSSLDRLFIYINKMSASGDTFATINWINPSISTDASQVNSPIYNSSLGFANSGSVAGSGYIDTNFNASTMGTAFTTTNNSILVGYLNSVSLVNAIYGARLNATTKNQYALLSYNGAWRHQYDNDDFPNFGIGALGNESRLQVIFSGGSTVYQYVNGSLVATRVSPPGGFGTIPNYNIYNCCINNNNVAQFFNGESYVKYFAAGAPINESTFDAIINNYLTSI
jgi:hypothetical protein